MPRSHIYPRFEKLCSILLISFLTTSLASGQGVGVNQTSPTSMLDVNGNVSIGASYSAIVGGAPANGLIVEGNVGIGTTSPASILQTVYTESTTSGSLYPGIRSGITLSGTPTANRIVYGNYHLISNNTPTSAFVNHVYANYNQLVNNDGAAHNNGFATYNRYVNNDATTLATTGMAAYNEAYHNSAGTSANLYGAQNYVINNNAAGTVTTGKGSLNYVLNNQAGTITNAHGSHGQVINQQGGSITNGYGHYGYVRNDQGTLSNARGNYGYVHQSVAGGTITNAYGLYGQVNGAAGTITNGYGAYLQMQGTIGTSWGVYATGETKNYLSGKIGIGTTDPGVAKTYIDNDGTDVGLYIGNGVPFGQAKLEIDGPAATHIWVAESGTRKFSVASGGDGYFAGNVGVGSATPGGKVDVTSASNTDGYWLNGRAAMTSTDNWLRLNQSSSFGNGVYTPGRLRTDGEFNVGSGGSRFLVQTGGNVGIGTTTVSYKLHINGTIKSTGITESSDIRWKQDVSAISEALDKVMSLQGVYYKWNTKDFPEQDFSDKRQMGLIAQEVEKIIPEVVNTDQEGYKSVEYSKLVAVLVEAIKEQQAEIEKQKKEMDQVKAENKGMKKDIESLQKRTGKSAKQRKLAMASTR